MTEELKVGDCIEYPLTRFGATETHQGQIFAIKGSDRKSNIYKNQ